MSDKSEKRAHNETEDGPSFSDELPMTSASFGRASVQHGALRQALQRLHEVLDAESDFLHRGLVGNFDDIMRRKSQCLLDLERLSGAINVATFGADDENETIKYEVSRIRDRLVESETMLARYMEAAQEVSAIINDGLRDAESDGTYTEAAPFGRYGR